MKKDKKAILGMNTAQQFIAGILTLVILAVLVLVVLAALKTTIPATRSNVSFINTSTAAIMNYTIDLQFPGTAGLHECVLAISVATNRTGGEGSFITADNFTVSECIISPARGDGLDDEWNNTIWNVSGSYSHTVGTRGDALTIIDNTTTGLSSLFGNAVTWFTLLGLVIIILIIGVVIGVVRGFGAEASSGSPRVAQI